MPSGPRSRQLQRGVLDDLLRAHDADPGPPVPPAATAAPAPASPSAARAHRRLTLNLPAEVVDRVRSAVYHSPGLTLSGLAESALNRELDRLERQQGSPFPQESGRLRRGRPVRLP